MKFVLQIAAVLIAFGLSSSNAQDPNVFCNFILLDQFPFPYTCQMIGLSIFDDENLPIVLGGNHLPGRGHNDVTYVEIMNSDVPFIITQFFTTFPNLEMFAVFSGGLTRIQSRAFSNAFNLRFVAIIFNQGLRTVHANAFDGAANIEFLDLSENGIDALHDDSFNGAPQIRTLFLDVNAIINLPPNVFRSLPALDELSVADNAIESLDGRLLENSPQMFDLNFSGNQINAVGRTFFDAFNSNILFSIDFRHNLCISNSWGGWISLDDVRRDMEQCFANSGETPVPDDVRNFILELRGLLVLRYENGTEVVRLKG